VPITSDIETKPAAIYEMIIQKAVP